MRKLVFTLCTRLSSYYSDEVLLFQTINVWHKTLLKKENNSGSLFDWMRIDLFSFEIFKGLVEWVRQIFIFYPVEKSLLKDNSKFFFPLPIFKFEE